MGISVLSRPAEVEQRAIGDTCCGGDLGGGDADPVLDEDRPGVVFQLMSTIEAVVNMLAEESGLAVVSTAQADGRVLSSVTNCGVIDHPITGESHVAFVSMAGASRLGHIRRGAHVTIAIRRGWSWLSVTGPAELIGPDQRPHGMDADALRMLLRDVFHAAGGTHDNLDEYDRAMAEEGRIVVFVTPDRILGNG